MKDLTVEIPRKYKKALTERFSLKNARKNEELWGDYWLIMKECSLCKNHIDCEECPFTKFRGNSYGCIVWINKILIPHHSFHLHIDAIEWGEEDNKQARKQLKLLKKKARELIKWV